MKIYTEYVIQKQIEEILSRTEELSNIPVYSEKTFLGFKEKVSNVLDKKNRIDIMSIIKINDYIEAEEYIYYNFNLRCPEIIVNLNMKKGMGKEVVKYLKTKMKSNIAIICFLEEELDRLEIYSEYEELSYINELIDLIKEGSLIEEIIDLDNLKEIRLEDNEINELFDCELNILSSYNGSSFVVPSIDCLSNVEPYEYYLGITYSELFVDILFRLIASNDEVITNNEFIYKFSDKIMLPEIVNNYGKYKMDILSFIKDLNSDLSKRDKKLAKLSFALNRILLRYMSNSTFNKL